uniref:Hva1_TUDOR domain-containing protein n=1 Tax=Parastrongyloides trichosuri TaxID=131310 RepID=A0A0N4Z0J4_PARTI
MSSNEENDKIRYVSWANKLEEVRYYLKGSKNNVYEASQQLPGKGILKNWKCPDSDGKMDDNNSIKPTIIAFKKDDLEEKRPMSKKEMRRQKKRERNKSKG